MKVFRWIIIVLIIRFMSPIQKRESGEGVIVVIKGRLERLISEGVGIGWKSESQLEFRYMCGRHVLI